MRDGWMKCGENRPDRIRRVMYKGIEENGKYRKELGTSFQKPLDLHIVILHGIYAHIVQSDLCRR
jgi:hypothetical protein